MTRHDFALKWMKDYDQYQAALESDSSYASTLNRSLGLVLEEFYNNLKTVGVSAVTGMGMDDFFKVSCSQSFHSSIATAVHYWLLFEYLGRTLVETP